MTDFLERWANASDANARLVAQEMLIAETTEALWEALEKAKLSKTELADRMGCTKGHVSQVLSGARNMTLRTLSDICFATGVQPKIVIESRDREDWRGIEDVVMPARYGKLRVVDENGELALPRCYARAA